MEVSSHLGITAPRGFRAAGAACGLKPSGKPDLALIVSDRDASAAGVFTRNKIKGEPVRVTRNHLRHGTARAIVCNSGLANVATGKQGRRDCEAMCQRVGERLEVSAKDVLVCSTGIIGRRLPMEKVLPGIDAVGEQLGEGSYADEAAANAILTTDRVTKHASRRLHIGGRTVTLAGIAKGSGMIGPNLATMLAMITTDAAVQSGALKPMLQQAVAGSFNRTSIDSDTSTSDSVLILANGAAGNAPIDDTRSAASAHGTFAQGLTELCRDLAEQLVRDGEGATRIFRLDVLHARNQRDADRVGHAVVNSPLVKTAVHGGDPNWGRLAMAAGKTSATVKQQTLSIRLGGLEVFAAGQPTALGLNPTAELEQAMQTDEVRIELDLGIANASAQWLGCDLSREYIRINADYTT